MAITAEQRAGVLELYTAYFNRAADAAGVDYWANEMDVNGWTLDQVAQSFADQTEYTTVYGGKTSTEITNLVYQNLLGRDSDTAGLAYWVGQLDASTLAVNDLIIAVTNAATEEIDGVPTNATDKALVDNKTAVSQYYYDQGLNETAVSLAAVTGVAETVTAATAVADVTAKTAAATAATAAQATADAAVVTVQAAITADDGSDTVATAQLAVDLANAQTATATAATAQATADAAAAADAAATVTYTITADVASVTEGGTVTFTVTASEALTVTSTTLNYQIAGVDVAGGTATPASDLGNVTGELTIAAGATTATFTAVPTDDGITEGFEGFNVAILDSAFATVATSSNVTIKDGAESGQTFVLTANTDTGGSFTGTTGNDSFTGVVGTTSTLTAGDFLSGGTGTDTLNVSVTGTGGQAVAGVVLASIEAINISNYTTAGAESLNLAQATGVTSVNSTGSAATGDTTITNVGNLVSTSMANGSGDLNITYTDAAVVGTTDATTLTVSNQSGGSFTAAGATTGGLETLNIVSNTSANVVAINDAVTATIKTMNISGDQQLTLTEGTTNANDAVTTINASTMTGKLLVTTGSAAQTMVITGGTSDDTITFSGNTFTAADTVDGGAGTDILSIATAITAATDLALVSNVETLKITGANNVTLAADTSVTNFDLSDTAANVLTLNTGVANAVSATIGITGIDQVNNAANVALTVNGVATAFGTTTLITGGTGTTDTINFTADTQADAAITLTTQNITAIDVINVLDGGDDAATGTKPAGDDATITTGAYATALTIDASALDAGTLTGTTMGNDDEVLTLVGTGATKVLTVTGGAGRDIITTGTANDIVNSGAGNDTITSTAGADTVNAGAGDDTITFGSSLTSADTIDGGEGTDTLNVTTISSTALANVTNVEVLAVTGASTVSLSSNLSFTSIDASDAAVQSLTFATGYTSATTVNLKTDAGDTIVNTANIALTVDATTATALTATTLTGHATGTTDAIIVSAGDGTVANATASTATGTFGATITLFDSITVRKGNDTGDDINLNIGAYATAMTIDASALTDVGTLNTAGTATTGNDSTLTLTATGTANLTVTGGAGWDVLSLTGTSNNTINTGAGNDTITVGATLTNLDTINGGDGTDTIVVDSTTALADVSFINVTNVENLTDNTATADITLASFASAAGIVKVTVEAGNGNDVVNASGMTTSIEIVGSTTTGGDDTLTGGTVDDTFTFSGTTGLEATDQIVGGTGTDTISLDNSAGAFSATGILVDDVAAATKVTGVEKFVVKDADGSSSTTAQTVTLTFGNTAAAAALSTIVDGSIITDTLDVLTVDASAVVDAGFFTTFNITGGAAADVLSGGNGADTISGGSGADTIDGGIGADTLTGGDAADSFVYASGDSVSAKMDTITDFTAGTDKLTITVAGDNIWDLTDKGDVTSNASGLSLLSSATTFGEYFFNTVDMTFVQDTDGNGLIQSSDTIIKLDAETGFADTDVNFIVTGTSGKSVTTGGGADTVTFAAAANDTAITGAGNDTIVFTTDGLLTNADVVTGGAGTDTLTLVDSGLLDADLAGVTQVETLNLSAASTVTLGANAITSGFATINLNAATTVNFASADTYTVNATSLANGAAFATTDAAAIALTITNLIGDLSIVQDAGGTVAIDLDDNTADSTITLGLNAGTDTVTVTGGATGDTVTVSGAAGIQTLDLSSSTNLSAFAITLGAGADVITLSTASVADTVVLTGAASSTVTTDITNTITNFSVTNDIIDLGTNSSFLHGGAALTAYAEGAKANIGTTIGLQVFSDNITVANAAVGPTEAEIETYLAATEVIFTVGGNGSVYIAADDGVNTYIMQINDGGTANKVYTAAEDDGVVLAILAGITDATTLSAANFADFA